MHSILIGYIPIPFGDVHARTVCVRDVGSATIIVCAARLAMGRGGRMVKPKPKGPMPEPKKPVPYPKKPKKGGGY
jgi:hypothetical protein